MLPFGSFIQLEVFSTLIGVALGVFAWICGRHASYRVYAGIIVGVGSCAFLAIHHASNGTAWVTFVADALLVAPAVLLLLLSPGLLIRADRPAWQAIGLSVLTMLLVAPAWLVYAVGVVCLVGGDCL